jgi:hypothetical protein
VGEPLGGPGNDVNGFSGGSDPEDALAFLADLQGSGLDVLSLLAEAEENGPTQTREGETAPGEGPSPGLEISEEALVDLAKELCDLVDRYQQATQPMVEQEQEIRDAYTQANARGTGPGLGSRDETLVSEAMMVQVDQVSARLTTNLTSVKPAIKVDPVLGTSFDDPALVALADSTESFLCEYVLNEMDYRHILPQAIHRSVKVGTAVARLEWAEEERTSTFYPRNASKQKTETIKIGAVRGPLIENRLMIVWPPTILNWQREYEVVGHESWHSRSSWKRLAASWKLTEEVRGQIEANPGERDETADKENTRSGVDSSHLDGSKLLDPQIKLTELWCHLWLPAPYNRRVKFQVILHRPTKTICWADLNRHFTQKHPYFPIRYKWSDLSAWGTGVGQEALNCWAADTALWNLSLENIAAGAFNIIIRDAGSVHNTIARPVRPGMEVVSSNPEKDYIVRSMGGDAAEIPATRQENQMRMKMATGVPDVSMGMGDPTMKSGAGTGSTLALIEQAGMKIRMVDQTMREDLSDLFGFTLELVAQYGDDGVFYNHVSEDDASRLERLRYYPPRGRDISSMFRIRAMAPSAATSTEARRNNMLVIWGFAQQAVMTMNEIVTPLLQAENPAGLARWQRSMADVLHEIMRRVLELHEVPGVLGLMMPTLPAATPEDEQINALNQQLQQAQGMIQQLQAQAQQLLGAQAPAQPGAPGQPEAAPQPEEATASPLGEAPAAPSTPMPAMATSMGMQ